MHSKRAQMSRSYVEAPRERFSYSRRLRKGYRLLSVIFKSWEALTLPLSVAQELRVDMFFCKESQVLSGW